MNLVIECVIKFQSMHLRSMHVQFGRVNEVG